jgi:hypothetical protein
MLRAVHEREQPSDNFPSNKQKLKLCRLHVVIRVVRIYAGFSRHRRFISAEVILVNASATLVCQEAFLIEYRYIEYIKSRVNVILSRFGLPAARAKKNQIFSM